MTKTTTKPTEKKSTVQLTDPFSAHELEYRVGGTTSDKSRGVVLAYVTTSAVQDRLDTAAAGWTFECSVRRPENTPAAVVTGTLTIGDRSMMNVGEESLTDSNAHTSAYAQAFKRCAASYGVGRYLYYMPAFWWPLDGKRFVFADELHEVMHALTLEVHGSGGDMSQIPMDVYKKRARSVANGERSEPAQAPVGAKQPTPRPQENRGGNGGDGEKPAIRDPEAPATDAQVRFAHQLMDKHISDQAEINRVAAHIVSHEVKSLAQLTKGDISAVIEKMKGRPKETIAESKGQTAIATEESPSDDSDDPFGWE